MVWKVLWDLLKNYMLFFNVENIHMINQPTLQMDQYNFYNKNWIHITSMWVPVSPTEFVRKLDIRLFLFLLRQTLKSPIITLGLLISSIEEIFLMTFVWSAFLEMYTPIMSIDVCFTLIKFRFSLSIESFKMNPSLQNAAMPWPLPPPQRLVS